MERSYDSLASKNKVNKAHLRQFSEGKLFLELIDIDQEISYEELVMSFCREIEEALELRNLQNLVLRMLDIEEGIKILYARRHLDWEQPKPDLGQAYKALSPLLLQAYVSESKLNLEKVWLESIRIVLENDLFHWKGLLHQLPQ